MSELMKKMAIQQFLDRATEAKQTPQVDNSKLYAGSPMYYYCNCCGIQTEVLREDFLFRPFAKCSQCLGLDQMGWLEEAMRLKNDANAGSGTNDDLD